MIRLECDYAEGAHERVLRRLFETNLEQTPGYGEDIHCARARERIRDLCGNPNLAVHFLVGGTQTNATVIAAALRPHQGVIAGRSRPLSGGRDPGESGGRRRIPAVL